MFLKGLYTVILLLISNVFMTLAWYGNIGLKNMKTFDKSVVWIVFLSWGIAFFEYCFMIPANRIGIETNGGPFNLYQLKTIQEAVTLVVFVLINIYIFKGETPQWNHIVGFLLMIAAVFVIFKKW